MLLLSPLDLLATETSRGPVPSVLMLLMQQMLLLRPSLKWTRKSVSCEQKIEPVQAGRYYAQECFAGKTAAGYYVVDRENRFQASGDGVA